MQQWHESITSLTRIQQLWLECANMSAKTTAAFYAKDAGTFTYI